MDPVTMTEMNTNSDKKVDNPDSESSFDSNSLIEVSFQLRVDKVMKRKRKNLILLYWEKSKS